MSPRKAFTGGGGGRGGLRTDTLVSLHVTSPLEDVRFSCEFKGVEGAWSLFLSDAFIGPCGLLTLVAHVTDRAMTLRKVCIPLLCVIRVLFNHSLLIVDHTYYLHGFHYPP